MTEFKRRNTASFDPEKPWNDDAFKTLQSYADFLTNALTANHSGFVLNVNGAWGTGKSFFVERWAEDFRKRNFPVVEFNAWENDSEDDPLTPLLAECTESLKEHFTEDQTLIEGIKNKGGRIALKVGGIAAKAGLRKLLGDDGAKDLCDIFSEDTEKDLIKLGGSLVDEQVKKKLERKSFVEELEALVTKLEEYGKLPIFIFIDELDRCRPTFAIELLERVKHLFNVDGIKFIISTDTKQLVHSIKGVYGHEFDATTYLQRFFDETFTLPTPNPHQFAELLFQDFDPERSWMNNWHVKDSPSYSFGELSTHFDLSLRQQLQAHHRVMAVVNNTPVPQHSKLHFIFICTLVFLRLKTPDAYDIIIGAQSQHTAWTEFASRQELTSDIFKVISEYFILTGLDYNRIRERMNAGDSDPFEARNNRTPEDYLISDVQCSVHNAFDVFKKYPKLVELTDYIDTPS
jgi:hypothetical protein